MVLDLWLAGVPQVDIARALGVTKQRAHQLVSDGAMQLAFRVFKGVKR